MYYENSLYNTTTTYHIMIIAISGVPGTGKTKAAELLSKHLKYKLISIKSLLKKVKTKKDKKRNVRIIDPKDLKKFIPKGNIIIEGHLSHFLKSDLLVILRTRPDVLERRLKKRKWPKNKIVENVEAEILDEITINAVDKNKNIMELDTSKLNAEKTAKIILECIHKKSIANYKPGKISWIDKYKNFLFKNE